MDQEIELHAYEIRRLQALDKVTIAKNKLKLFIEAYKSGELTADDLRNYTNINPDEIHMLEGT